ncbi:FAD-dependent monooxygenase [Streptomyces peucetius]
MLRGQVAHTLLLHADDDASLERSARLAVEIRNLTHGQVGACLVLGAEVSGDATGPPAWWDSRGEFRRVDRVTGPTGFLPRPDGHVGLRQAPPTAPDRAAHLGGVLRI